MHDYELKIILDYVGGGSTDNFEMAIQAGNVINIISVLDNAKNISEYEITVSNSKYPSIVTTDTLEMPEDGFQGSDEIVKVVQKLLEEAEQLVA